MNSKTLLTPVTSGAFNLANRIIMAPMTRNRADEGNSPTKLNTIYYTQRATAGLIISEACQVSPMGKGYPFSPGIHSQEQIIGWRNITEAVHAAGGKMALQL